MANHFRILALRTPLTVSPQGYSIYLQFSSHKTATFSLLLQVYIFSFIVFSLYIWEAQIWAQMVKNLPAMQETWVQSLSWEDPLEEEMTTHSSILAWRIPWIEEPGRLQYLGLQRVGHD